LHIHHRREPEGHPGGEIAKSAVKHIAHPGSIGYKRAHTAPARLRLTKSPFTRAHALHLRPLAPSSPPSTPPPRLPSSPQPPPPPFTLAPHSLHSSPPPPHTHSSTPRTTSRTCAQDPPGVAMGSSSPARRWAVARGTCGPQVARSITRYIDFSAHLTHTCIPRGWRVRARLFCSRPSQRKRT
jgi:hypothetical protein